MSSGLSTDPPALREGLARWLSQDVVGLERIGGGRNSQVYRIETGDGRRLALKAYFRHPGDQRDRLAVEFGSFTFLWARGFREIPQPVASHPEAGWAIYQFVEGERLGPGQAGEAEVRAATEFLGRLRELSRQPESRKLGEASEAFFSIDQVVEHVRRRLERLRHAEGEDHARNALHAFLQDEFTPLLERVAQWSERRTRAAGGACSAVLPWSERTLSPSDFGFHNVLRRPDGQIIFLDFEYFGWDDPAKMITDFLLHPAMDLSAGLKRQFAAALFHRFADWPALRARVECVYPLFGLKWCMILLNEFLPVSLQRRQFAAATGANRTALQMQQLAKARRMIERMGQEYESFPYHD